MEPAAETAVAAASRAQSSQRRAWIWLRMAIGGALLAWLIGSVDWIAARTALPRVHGAWVLGCALLYLTAGAAAGRINR